MAVPASSPQPSTLSVSEAVNRGYNLLAAVILGVLGGGFTELIFGEPDPIDKVDNTILLLVGLAAVTWYLVSRARWRRSPIPIALGGVALAGQVFGIAVEIGDPMAIGDDFGGLTLYSLAFIMLIVLYLWNRRYAP